MCDFDPEAGQLVGKPHQVTSISTGADGAIWLPDGKNIVFVSAVYPDCNPPPPGSGVTSDDCNKKRDEELKKSKVKAKIFTRLFYRHWNAFTEFKRSHLFVLSGDARADRSTDILSVRQAGVSPAESQTSGETPGVPTGKMPVPRDLTPGDHDVPPFSLGGQDMYAISPDGQEVAYTSNIDEVEATSTNNEIFVVPISGPATVGKKISTSPGADTTPLYSYDGRWIGWRSQARAGFEADKWRLLLYNRELGRISDLTKDFDRSVGSFTWALQISEIVFTAEDKGESPLYSVPLITDEDGVGIHGGKILPGPRLHADDLAFRWDRLFFSRNSISAPNDIWQSSIMTWDKTPDLSLITHMNDGLLSQIDMQPLESFTFKGANNDEVQGFLVRPPGFDPNKKYPLKFLIHGGPQGAWGNSWTYRWNAELFAATG